MLLTAYDLALIAGGFTVVGTLVGALVIYRLALDLARVNAKRDTGRRLREAFAPELAALDPAPTRPADVKGRRIDGRRVLPDSRKGGKIDRWKASPNSRVGSARD